MERQLRQHEGAPFHSDVYYLAPLEFEELQGIYGEFHHFFADDGLLKFGFASQEARQEVFVGSFKVLDIFTDDPHPFEQTLKSLGYEPLQPFKTVHANFSKQTPGELTRVEAHGKSIYDMITTLTVRGLYLKDRREDVEA